MRHVSLVLAALAAVLPAGVAAQSAQTTFEHDGTSYTYTVSTDRHGHQIVTGQSQPGASFRYVVVGDRVEGHLGEQLVSFRMPKAHGAALAAR